MLSAQLGDEHIFCHATLCLNPLVISTLIREIFHFKRTTDAHIEVFTITAGRSCSCVLIFVISLLFLKFETEGNRLCKQFGIIIVQKTTKIIFYSSKHTIFHDSQILLHTRIYTHMIIIIMQKEGRQNCEC